MSTASSSPLRVRHLLLLFFSLLLAIISTLSSSTSGMAAATPVLSNDIDSDAGNGRIRNSNNNDESDSEININNRNLNQADFAADDTSSNNDDDDNNNINNNNNGENGIALSAIPPVEFSFLPISSPISRPANTDDQPTNDASSIVQLTLHFELMFPEAARSNPLLGGVYKAYHSFDDGPMDAAWAIFEGGLPGVGRTKCTIEGRDDFEVTNFMREGEMRFNIWAADYIWCVTSL